MTDAQYDRMGTLLSRFRSSRAMNLEMLDGFFAALICCPDMVRPGEYLPEIWGGDMADEEAWESREQLQEFMDLVMQHWNTISRKLQAGDIYLPILLEDEQGVAHANDWATGFMRGMSLRHYVWNELISSEEHGGSLIPILALANEHHPDPRMRPYKEPMDAPDHRNGRRAHQHLSLLRAESMLSSTRGRCRKYLPPHDRKGRAQRPVPLRIWQEVQALLRKQDVPLMLEAVGNAAALRSAGRIEHAVRRRQGA